MSWILSVCIVTAPLLTLKSVASKLAIPLLLSVASSADIVTVAVSEPLPLTSIPSPALISAT